MVSMSEVGKMDSFPDGLVVKKNARVVSLSGDAEEFFPEAVSSGVPLNGRGQKVTGTRDATGEVFRLSDAVVLTPAVAGAASPAVFAGAVALADLAGTDVPAIAGMELPAIAEDFSLADDAGRSPSVIRVIEPLRPVVGAVPLMDVWKTSSVVGRRPAGFSDSDVRRNSEEGSSPIDIVTVPELIEHSAVGGSLICLLLASRWKTPGNQGICRVVGRAKQTTEISHLMLGPRDMSHSRKGGSDMRKNNISMLCKQTILQRHL